MKSDDSSKFCLPFTLSTFFSSFGGNFYCCCIKWTYFVRGVSILLWSAFSFTLVFMWLNWFTACAVYCTQLFPVNKQFIKCGTIWNRQRDERKENKFSLRCMKKITNQHTHLRDMVVSTEEEIFYLSLPKGEIKSSKVKFSLSIRRNETTGRKKIDDAAKSQLYRCIVISFYKYAKRNRRQSNNRWPTKKNASVQIHWTIYIFFPEEKQATARNSSTEFIPSWTFSSSRCGTMEFLLVFYVVIINEIIFKTVILSVERIFGWKANEFHLNSRKTSRIIIIFFCLEIISFATIVIVVCSNAFSLLFAPRKSGQ